METSTRYRARGTYPSSKHSLDRDRKPSVGSHHSVQSNKHVDYPHFDRIEDNHTVSKEQKLHIIVTNRRPKCLAIVQSVHMPSIELSLASFDVFPQVHVRFNMSH